MSFRTFVLFCTNSVTDYYSYYPSIAQNHFKSRFALEVVRKIYWASVSTCLNSSPTLQCLIFKEC